MPFTVLMLTLYLFVSANENWSYIHTGVHKSTHRHTTNNLNANLMKKHTFLKNSIHVQHVMQALAT